MFCKFLILKLIFCLVYMIFQQVNGVEQTRHNTNTVNVNFLLSESGRQSEFGANSQLSQSGSHTQNRNGQSSGKVNDLINFYNNNEKTISTPSKPSSYSSVVSGAKPGNNVQGVSQNGGTNVAQNIGSTQIISQKIPLNPTTPPKMSSKQSTKPTFSEIVSGGNRNSNPTSNTNNNLLTPLPANPTTKPNFSTIGVSASGSTKPTSSHPTNKPKPPNAVVLPSAIINNNRQGGTANGNTVSDLELQTLSEELLRKDTNNAANLITINYQQKTTSHSLDDKALQPLITIPDSVYNIPTIQKFVPLLDNYERDTLINEHVTPLERNEENAFMDVVMQTQVIRQLMTFLKDKGYVTPDPRQQRDFLKQMWFNLYSRGRGKIGSSGFEHVFLSELKNREVSGLHNWLYFAREELANRINYLGYLKYEQLGNKGAVLKHHFNQQGTDKPVDSMFIGTSPELEMALYSLCFITRADQSCPLKLAGKNVNIETHTFRYRSKNLIGSAYPRI